MTERSRHASVPSARFTGNPFERSLREGVLSAGDLLPFAVNLHELVDSNAASSRLMAHRHAEGRFGEFYRTIADGEAEALRLLAPFVDAVREAAPVDAPAHIDPLAQAYPAYIARVAVKEGASDYLLCYLHLSSASTRIYREVAKTLKDVAGFTDQDLTHFVFFGDTDPETNALAETVARRVGQPELTRGLELAQHLQYFEDLFWRRMLSVCTGRNDAYSI